MEINLSNCFPASHDEKGRAYKSNCSIAGVTGSALSQTYTYTYNSRYYDPAIGRFINPDDVALLGANGDFISLNLYAYCGNNPVVRSDDGGEPGMLQLERLLGDYLN